MSGIILSWSEINGVCSDVKDSLQWSDLTSSTYQTAGPDLIFAFNWHKVIVPTSLMITDENGIVLIFFESSNGHPYNTVPLEGIQSKKSVMFDSVSQFTLMKSFNTEIQKYPDIPRVSRYTLKIQRYTFQPTSVRTNRKLLGFDRSLHFVSDVNLTGRHHEQ